MGCKEQGCRNRKRRIEGMSAEIIWCIIAAICCTLNLIKWLFCSYEWVTENPWKSFIISFVTNVSIIIYLGYTKGGFDTYETVFTFIMAILLGLELGSIVVIQKMRN